MKKSPKNRFFWLSGTVAGMVTMKMLEPPLAVSGVALWLFVGMIISIAECAIYNTIWPNQVETE